MAPKKSVTETKTLVLVTTNYRGVFAGYLKDDNAPDFVTLTNARNVIYWHQNVNGVFGLAATGPSEQCRIGPAVEELRAYQVTSMTKMSADAQKKWEALG